MKKLQTRCSATALALAALLCLTTLSTGCLWAPDLARIRKEIQRQMPEASFDKEIELTLGPISLGFARFVTKLIPDARDANEILRNVRKIELAVYNAESIPENFHLSMPAKLKEMLSREGWELAVKAREGNQLVWILYKTDNDTVKQLYAVVLDAEELVMVRAEGNLEGLLARALMETDEVRGLPRTADARM